MSDNLFRKDAALTREDALKHAAREFRGQDKRRAAKSRWEAAIAAREALARAPVLIDELSRARLEQIIGAVRARR